MSNILSKLPARARTQINSYLQSGKFEGKDTGSHPASELEQKETFVSQMMLGSFALTDEMGPDEAKGEKGHVYTSLGGMDGYLEQADDGQSLSSVVVTAASENGELEGTQYMYADKNVYVNLMESGGEIVGKAYDRDTSTLTTLGNYNAIPEMPEFQLDMAAADIRDASIKSMLAGQEGPGADFQREMLQEMLTPRHLSGMMFS